jgi:hypothetical protein
MGPLPAIILEAIAVADQGDLHHFWNGACTLKSRLAE